MIVLIYPILKHKIHCFSILILVLFFVSCDKTQNNVYKRIEGQVFGTSFHIICQDSLNRNIEGEVQQLFKDVNSSLSTYDATSLISRINDGAPNLKIDSLLGEVYHLSSIVCNLTEGYFDPTIGSLVNAWGFGPKKWNHKPTDSEIDSLLEGVGFHKLQLDQGVIVKHTTTFLDFNAVAKGYGVDIIANYLESLGIDNYLVEIGGEIHCKGKNEKGYYWSVGIEEPHFDGSRSLQNIVQLKDEVMATSGNYRKFKVDSITGKKYAHTLSVKTGKPARTDLLSASVISTESCAMVDALATAFMAMGVEKTKLFLNENPKLKAYLIYSDKSGALQTYKTENLVTQKD